MVRPAAPTFTTQEEQADAVRDELTAWQNSPRDAVHPVVGRDALFVREGIRGA